MIQLRPQAAPKTYILLEYQGTAGQRIFAALSAVAWLGSIAVWLRRKGSTASASTS
jgi:hypothetical protein